MYHCVLIFVQILRDPFAPVPRLMVMVTSSSPKGRSSAFIMLGTSEMGYAASLKADTTVEPA